MFNLLSFNIIFKIVDKKITTDNFTYFDTFCYSWRQYF